MNNEQRAEIKDLLHDLIAGYSARVESQFSIIDLKLENICKQTTKTNNRTTKNEDDISTLNDKSRDLEEALKLHNVSCPLSDRVVILENKDIMKTGIGTFVKLVLASSLTILTIISLLILIYRSLLPYVNF